ncbi:response regulator [Pseudoduganella sp. DS3]|uniref:Response regulator n=1 Tax=Pseudoduganella guangdongensis TaxID=2692179 RepID=A0A6N9HBC0_9BURK|nr:response regulator [Pseudoduganella guangdongensis]MYN00798.1 response regulator [Pseudoduganella guangdongensis]
MTELSPPPSPPLRILLVDDDPFMLSMLADMLEDLGQLNVRSESDARQALLALPQFRPDLLICDLSMPELDGIEFLQKAADRHFAGAVVLLSGMDASVRQAADTLARAHGLSLLGTLAKPATPAALRQLLGKIRGQV